MTNIGDSSISHKPEYTNRSRQSAACKRTFILFVSPGDVTIYIYIYMKIPYIYIKNLGGNFHVNEPHKTYFFTCFNRRSNISAKKIAFKRRSLLRGASIATK